MEIKKDEIHLYTDGAYSMKTKRGGIGAIIRDNGKIIQLKQKFVDSTNNRMEILAIIIGLEYIKKNLNNKMPITIFSDSRTSISWVKKQRTTHPDLNNRLVNSLKGLNYEIYWVKAHAGNKYNEMADQLASK